MKHILIIILLLLAGFTYVNAQVENPVSSEKKQINYALKTNPLSLLTYGYKLVFEQTVSQRIGLEYEVGFRSFNGEVNSKLKSGFIAFRPKYYFAGKAQRGFYFAPGVSYEIEEKISNPTKDWVRSNFLAGFIDLGFQYNIRKLVLETFIGMGGTTDKGSTGFLDLGDPTGTYLGFSNQLIFRAGVRVGIGW